MNKKVLTVIKIFMVFALLLSLSIFSVTAENTPYSDNEIEKIGIDQFKILGLYGTHRFNLSEPGNTLFSEGYILFSNTYNTSITISLSTTNKLSILDLDENGDPRVHNKTVPPIHESVVFNPIYDPSWIKLDETVFTIEPRSQYKTYYAIEMPKNSVWKHIDEDTANGFLGYIIIKEKKDANPGMNIGIDYRYKVFTLFTGECSSDVFFIDPIYFVIFAIVIVGIIVTYILSKKLELVEVDNGGKV